MHIQIQTAVAEWITRITVCPHQVSWAARDIVTSVDAIIGAGPLVPAVAGDVRRVTMSDNSKN